MAYSHGKIWTENEIKEMLLEIVKIEGIKHFPTHKNMKEFTGNCGLSCAVSKHGGSLNWAKKLGLPIKDCESRLGIEYENKCMELLKRFGYRCKTTSMKHPYDILVEGNIKIDVKVGRIYKHGKDSFYTFNLEKKDPTCDIFVCYCVSDKGEEKVYVIPSCIMSGKTQLSIGVNKSKYDRYIDAWEFLATYEKFYRKIEQESA